MTETLPEDRSDEPITVERIASDLRDLGLGAGDTVLVHSSLSALGWVCGGPVAVVDALQQVVTAEGTLVMPAHTGDYSDPGSWQNPPVPDDWEETIRETMPAYRPEVTPCTRLGAVPDTFRSYPGVERSRHPVVSFAAWGAEAEAITADHSYDEPLGEQSPLARLYERDADVLMLGTDHGTNTSLHLAEYRDDLDKEMDPGGAPVIRDGERVWLRFVDIELDTSDFPQAGAAFEEDCPGAVTVGEVGEATARRIDQPSLVDFAAEWFTEHRPESLEED
ncbi:aminoglycoside N(3)-acetyltransferase [Haloarchaeobius amylolyticus]|uniref:aminoglycoside N(3)-acetyltransferase n=1 Tax=Haloarchaeobius amylolyticus TaxID=1198296 RepID=UPI00227153FA|nr:AAC(3) family N-acetyltransferase [Haloarchaeobius amylolyticus]